MTYEILIQEKNEIIVDLQEQLKSKDEQIKSLQQQLSKTQADLKLAVDGLIFYSDMEKYEETHEQLDWSLVNNPSAIQDKGKYARLIIKQINENEG